MSLSSRFLGALSVLSDVLSLSTRQLLGGAAADTHAGGIKQWAAAASQASAALQALTQLEQQDKALSQKWATQLYGPISKHATPEQQQPQDLQAVISQLRQLQKLVPDQRLERLSRWALQEGLGELVTKGRPGAGGTLVSVSTCISDPFGLLMAYQGVGHSFERLTPVDYILDVGVMRMTLPELVVVPHQQGNEHIRETGAGVPPAPSPSPLPLPLQAVMQYCQARRALLAAWQLLSSKGEPSVAGALNERMHHMCAESAGLRSFCQRLLTWQAAHRLMLARDMNKVNMNLLRLQLEGKLGASASESKAMVALQRAEHTWTYIMAYVGNGTTSDSSPAHVVLNTRLDVEQLCAQLVEDLQVVQETLTPHRSVTLEVSVLLNEYEEMIREYERH